MGKGKGREKSEVCNICLVHPIMSCLNMSDAPKGKLEPDLSSVPKDAELYILGNAVELIRDPKRFIEHIVRLKTRVGNQKLIYTPGLGEPSYLALLVYCGIDLFDSVQLILNARRGYFLDSTGKIAQDTQSLSEPICYCPACRQNTEDPKNEEFDGRSTYQWLVAHNYYAAISELNLIKHAIRRGRLRELVESRALAESWQVALLRILDKTYYEFQERNLPIMRPNQLMASSREALDRPEVVRFRERLKARYTPPQSPKVLLFLPCSAKKPYTFSKSHRRFKNAIRSCGNPHVIHEVIVTSPLGIVPRELELFYPAQHYEIPVTGEWYEDELEMIRDMVGWLIDKNKYDLCVVHLSKGSKLTECICDVIGNKIDTINSCVSTSSPSASENIEQLKKVFRAVTHDYRKDTVSRTKRRVEDMRARAIFQFDTAGGTALVNNAVTIKGKYPYLRILKCDTYGARGRGKSNDHNNENRTNMQLGMLIGDRGMISLTPAGGALLASKSAYWVEIEDFVPVGNVFAVGVIEADPRIRPQDDVVVVHSSEVGGEVEVRVRAVGRAVMGAREMVESNRGIAVKVRRRVEN